MRSDSPAIDKGNSFGSTSDQRGSTRPFDDPNTVNTGDGSDIGAFERQAFGNVQSFANGSPIAITNASGAGTPASVYPSIISVANFTSRNVGKVTVTLNGLSHSWMQDLDIILEAPNGAKSFLTSDAGGSSPGVSNIDLIFDQAAAGPILQSTIPATGTYQPANYGTGDTFPSPGPSDTSSITADLNVFNGIDPNGDWKLYVVDDADQDVGQIAGGWTLNFTFVTTRTVTKIADTNDGVCDADCSLREAIAASEDGDIINFSSLFNTSQTITLGGNQLVINKSIIINGPGADKLTISGNNMSRVFEITSTFNVTLDGLTIRSGLDFIGGGIRNFGNLTLINLTVSDNSVSGGFGGGIYNDGNLTLTNSTISNNLAGDGGGIGNIGNLTLTNTTISNNSVSFASGGIENLGNLTLTNSTISNNSAFAGGGGVFNYSSSTVNSRNTIIADNTAGTNPDFSGHLNSQGYNLIGNAAGTTISGDTTGNQLNVDPMLAPLGNYGGTTQTHALLQTSPAIDKGNSFGSTTDQRGLTRPFDIAGLPPASGGDNSDIGAYETQVALVVNTNDSGAGSLRNAIDNSPAGSDIFFGIPLFDSPQTITLTSGELAINKNLNIFGKGADKLIISGNDTYRVFNIGSNFNVHLSGLTIINGNAGEGGGIE